MTTLAVTAPAKINLHLQVLGRRGDGFHDVRTLLQSIDLTDEVRASPAPQRTTDFHVEPQGAAPPGEDNMVLRAAAELRRCTGTTEGATLTLKKKIPVGAGLGGGSVDAAATLVLLDALWNLEIGRSGLLEIAAGLGSDVPFFLHGGAAFCRGRGDEVMPLPDPEPRGILVVIASMRASTGAVFTAFDTRLTSAVPEATVDALMTDRTPFGSTELSWEHLFNDLESVVIGMWPEVGSALDALRRQGPLHAAMTGSGTATFAVFPDIETASQSAARLGDNWRSYVGSTLPRAQAALAVRRCEVRKENGTWK